MEIELAAFFFSATTVVIAEMGDKTQLLAMAFALKYKWWKVMIGVFGATIINHGLAVALGSILGRIESTHVIIQAIASISFIIFGLWTLKGDKLGDETKKASRFGPIITVAIAFFLAEMGDKTQLATIALAAKYSASPFAILMGTTTGMVLADGFGIIVGVVLCKKIPERIVKIGAAVIFMIFGIISTFQIFREEMAMNMRLALVCILAFITATVLASIYIIRKYPTVKSTTLIEAACFDKNSSII